MAKKQEGGEWKGWRKKAGDGGGGEGFEEQGGRKGPPGDSETTK